MKSKRMLAIAVGAGISPLLAVTLPASNASAHGYISTPPSRQAQCAAGTVSCGSIKYEPQSVEGPKGLMSCSGGNSAFAELDNDSKGWKVTPVSRTTSFNWRLTAQHATSTWQYYAGGRTGAGPSRCGVRAGFAVPSCPTGAANSGSVGGRAGAGGRWR
ncbi:Chitin-binding type-4 domain-containing protein OS=Streptomyces fumanus OX=67302 GN=GCM10018772_61890 PE=4 SV=1 [Streptomyces fumanus]